MFSSIVNCRGDQKCPIEFLGNSNWETLSFDWKAPKRSNKKPQTQDFRDTRRDTVRKVLSSKHWLSWKGGGPEVSVQTHGCWGCPVSSGGSSKEAHVHPTEFQDCLAFLCASAPPYPNQGQLGQLSKGTNNFPLWLPSYTCIEQSRRDPRRARGRGWWWGKRGQSHNVNMSPVSFRY